MLTIHDNSEAASGANCGSVWLIAPMVSGVAGLSASSSSKADSVVTDIALFSTVALKTLIFY